MLPNHRPGGGLPPDPYPRSRRQDDITRQARGLRRGSPVYRHASPSPSRHPSRSSSRHPSPSPSHHHSRHHRQHSRDRYVHSRSRPIAMPDYRNKSSKAHHHPEYISSRRSEDSVSSSVSSSGSLFDKERSGYSSSRTSLEDEAEPPKRGRRSPEGRTIRERRLDRSCADGATSATAEDGNSLWSRVAMAAGTLTVSVSKAWATNVTTNSSEDTPPGDESQLFRVMKAYHLDKARDPSDLPPWLFSEQERRPVGQLRLGSRQDMDGSNVQASPLSPRGLRDIYDTAATVTSPISPRSYADIPTSKAASHLKALRDAKRNVLSPNATSPREEEHDEVQQRRRAHRRMGMPVMKHGRF